MDAINRKEAYPVEQRENSSDPVHEKVQVKDGDEALNFLRGEAVPGEADAVDEKRLVKKIDWMIMPLMFCCYLLQFLDKSLLNYAAVMGIREDLDLDTNQYANLALLCKLITTRSHSYTT